MPHVIAAFLLSFTLLFAPQMAQANPLLGGGAPAVEEAQTTPGISASFFQIASQWQKKLHETVADHVAMLKSENPWPALWLLLAIGFIYGVLHVLLPGHGKVVVASYFLGHKAHWGEGIRAGFIMAVGHTLTAIALVILLNTLLGFTHFDTIAKARYAEIIGYGLIALIGLWLLISAVQNKGTGCAVCDHEHAHGHHHEHNHGHQHDHEGDKKKSVMLFAGASLVPCPGGMIILLYTLANDVLWAGVLTTLFIALGMWVTITIIGFISMALRHMLTLDMDTPFKNTLRRIFRIGSALVIMGVGLVFALSASQAPF